jgi:hypothetical protein
MGPFGNYSMVRRFLPGVHHEASVGHLLMQHAMACDRAALLPHPKDGLLHPPSTHAQPAHVNKCVTILSQLVRCYIGHNHPNGIQVSTCACSRFDPPKVREYSGLPVRLLLTLAAVPIWPETTHTQTGAVHRSDVSQAQPSIACITTAHDLNLIDSRGDFSTTTTAIFSIV